jgi:formate dehydrogenase iron-sulfur subunit
LPALSSKGYHAAVLAFCSLAGAAALLSSIMVYVDTPRVFWSAKQTVPRFLGTTLLLGTAGTAMFANEPLLFAAITFFAIAKLASEIIIFKKLSAPNDDPLARSARLMITALKPLTTFRFATLLGGGVILAQFAFTREMAPAWIAPTIFPTLLLSELAERSLFFRAVAQPKMPGGVA